MPILTPSSPPPRSPLATRTSNILTPSGLVGTPDKLPPVEVTESQENDRLVDEPSRRIPRVILAEDEISDAIVSQLATSILGHVLFLKNQVPFPVKQLPRVPIGKSNPRALKLKNELLDSYDTISAHFLSTFRAISTSLAKVRTSSTDDEKTVSKIYMAILLGPSIGTAKSKVVVGVDGFETKVWGLDVVREREERKRAEAAIAMAAESDQEDQEGESEDEENDSAEDSETEDGASPQSDEEDPPSSDASDDGGSDEEASEDDIPSPPSPPPQTHHTTPIVHYSAEVEKSIRAAERLLSRTLAQTEADGMGMAAEMAPTQTHILIRAPRRFDHPAWIPRQNLQASMDGMLKEYLQEANLANVPPDPATFRKKKKGSKVEGVWIGCRTPAGNDPEDRTEVPENDEMIWWSWDGKLVGFSDW